MSLFPQNIFQQVQTYQPSGLGLMLNLCCHVSTANMKFENFQNEIANLGSAVSLQLPYRFTTSSGLVANWQPVEQRLTQLVCDQSNNTSITVTNQQRVFNLDNAEEDFVTGIAWSAIASLANNIEANVALNWDSTVTSSLTNTLNTFSGPYRFYGDGVSAITSYQQLQQSIVRFRNFGSVPMGMKYYLPDVVIPSVVGNGLNQFVPHRNDDIAMSWEVGDFGNPVVQFYQSNLMPIHVSGNVGVNGTTLTLVSTNDPTGANVTQLTFSGATASDASAIFAGDLFQFNDGVANQPNMRFKTFIGTSTTANPVQFRATAAVAATAGGNVTINITPALNWSGNNVGNAISINNPLAAGMTVTSPPSHRCGGIVGDKAFFVAMPRLPDQHPFPTANKADPATGASVRLTYSVIPGQNQMGFVYDEVHGSLMVPDYCSRTLFPLSQS